MAQYASRLEGDPICTWIRKDPPSFYMRGVDCAPTKGCYLAAVTAGETSRCVEMSADEEHTTRWIAKGFVLADLWSCWRVESPSHIALPWLVGGRCWWPSGTALSSPSVLIQRLPLLLYVLLIITVCTCMLSRCFLILLLPFWCYFACVAECWYWQCLCRCYLRSSSTAFSLGCYIVTCRWCRLMLREEESRDDILNPNIRRQH